MEGSPVEEMTMAQYFARHALFGLVALGMLLPAVFGDYRRGWVRRLLGNRALLHFGMVSYGVYLWHLAWIIQLVHWDLGSHEVIGPSFTWLPIVVGGAWILGSLSYYLVERPALAQKPAPSPTAGRRRHRSPRRDARAVRATPLCRRLRDHAREEGAGRVAAAHRPVGARGRRAARRRIHPRRRVVPAAAAPLRAHVGYRARGRGAGRTAARRRPPRRAGPRDRERALPLRTGHPEVVDVRNAPPASATPTCSTCRPSPDTT